MFSPPNNPLIFPNLAFSSFFPSPLWLSELYVKEKREIGRWQEEVLASPPSVSRTELCVGRGGCVLGFTRSSGWDQGPGCEGALTRCVKLGWSFVSCRGQLCQGNCFGPEVVS